MHYVYLICPPPLRVAPEIPDEISSFSFEKKKKRYVRCSSSKCKEREWLITPKCSSPPTSVTTYRLLSRSVFHTQPLLLLIYYRTELAESMPNHFNLVPIIASMWTFCDFFDSVACCLIGPWVLHSLLFSPPPSLFNLLYTTESCHHQECIPTARPYRPLSLLFLLST